MFTAPDIIKLFKHAKLNPQELLMIRQVLLGSIHPYHFMQSDRVEDMRLTILRLVSRWVSGDESLWSLRGRANRNSLLYEYENSENIQALYGSPEPKNPYQMALILHCTSGKLQLTSPGVFVENRPSVFLGGIANPERFVLRRNRSSREESENPNPNSRLMNLWEVAATYREPTEEDT